MLVLGEAETREFLERVGDTRVLLAEGRFPNGERALTQRLGPTVQALIDVEVGEGVERSGEMRVSSRDAAPEKAVP